MWVKERQYKLKSENATKSTKNEKKTEQKDLFKLFNKFMMLIYIRNKNGRQITHSSHSDESY
jgi:hypothetical protein